MASRERADRQAGRDPGWSPSLLWLALAVGVLGGAWAYWWFSPKPGTLAEARPQPQQPPATAPGPAPPAAVVNVASAPAAPPPAALPPPTIPRVRDPDGDQTPDLADYVNPGERPTMGQVIERLHQAGVYSGLGAFSPPGTRPPLVGLAVPEDYPLPEGYVRHYQATDDGQRIEPILMFAPDRQFFDASGQPIAVPKDRVVPPEHAPAGLPIRRIAIPAPVEPGRTGS